MTAGGWTLVELCAGSAALSMHLLGAEQSLVNYQGSKWSVRSELETVVRALGFEGPPSRVVLGDVSPIADAVALVLRDRAAVLAELQPLVAAGEADPAELFARLSKEPVPEQPARRVAVLLWLQTMNYNGKAVGARVELDGMRWVVHGLNKTHAYGTDATASFGRVEPQGARLLEAVARAPALAGAVGLWGAEAIDPYLSGPTLGFIDPPYAGTTLYPSGNLTRSEVVAEARKLAAMGVAVIVSEAVPIPELVADGWRPLRLRGATRKGSRQKFRRATGGEEWVTVNQGFGALSAASRALFDIAGRAAERVPLLEQPGRTGPSEG